MIYKTILITILSSIAFYFAFPKHIPFSPSIQEEWVWNKSFKAGIPSFYGFENTKEIFAYRIGNEIYSISSNSSFKIAEESTLVEYPPMGKGFLVYKKLGNSIQFYSNEFEELWNKNYDSYPRVSPTLDMILLISGDHNQIEFLNSSGDPKGIGKLGGRFLTDFQFGYSPSTIAIQFSGGESYLLSSDGQILWKKISDSQQMEFYKSIAVSFDSKYLAVHSQKGNADFIDVVHVPENKLQYSYQLDRVYPHKLYFAISQEGVLQILSPNKNLVVGKDGKKIFEEEIRSSIYNPIACYRNGLVSIVDSKLIVRNHFGNVIYKKSFANLEFPVRILPSLQGAGFYVEDKKEFFYFHEF